MIAKVLPFLFILFSIAQPASIKREYRLLMDLRHSIEDMARFFPQEYYVPVTLSGSVYNEVLSNLSAIGVDSPEFAEVMTRGGKFKLMITNANYPAKTKEMLLGLLNPVDMMNTVLKSVLNYSSEDYVRRIQKETSYLRSVNGCNVTLSVFPKGTRFSYSYKDMGAYLFEGWLTHLKVVADTSKMLVRELEMTKNSRIIDVGEGQKPPVSVKKLMYKFFYKMINGHEFPLALEFYTDSMLVLTIESEYKVVKNKVLFSKRIITFKEPSGKKGTININYGKYSFDGTHDIESGKNNGVKYSKRLQKASESAQRAMNALENGNIQTAVNILQTIIQRYPETPYAIEAKKLLSGVFENL